MMKRMVASGVEAVRASSTLERVAEPLEHERRADDELELELGMVAGPPRIAVLIRA